MADKTSATTATASSSKEKVTAVEQIKTALEANARSATFACGGSIGSKPVQIRFGESGQGITLDLPSHDANSTEFDAFLKTSQPATFAHAGKEVLDEDYRKAGKLDRGSFATDFCPYESGIVDTIAQMLVPQTKHFKHARSVKAELYKLNVYSAPSGKFKPHVDTPRSGSQLGSLVVLLPVDHEGGQLVVRNAGSTSTFDGSNKKQKSSIKWAAFYSDCEHEVLEVTSGHRVTLTYNLYVTRGVGHLAGHNSTLNPTSLPLYTILKTALADKSWLGEGHVLAVWLTHSYAHTSKNDCFLPDSLKGADMSLYETVRALNLRCDVVPVIKNGDYDYYDSKKRVDTMEPAFEPLRSGEIHECSDPGEEFGRRMPRDKYSWINKPQQGLEEAQTAFVYFGNELGSLDVKYTRAAMLIRVPPAFRRGEPEDENASIWDARSQEDFDEEYDY